ncbi:pectin lyase fold/virulence factor [Rostrohypoxylon terebratum]|nr:pectin lyase fold/virulence factor [Rostrohypoxylon terebratum]
MNIVRVAAENGDAIGINDYDGLVDISRGSQWVAVSNTYFHDHWKAPLIGHSDSNAEEDQGALHITYAGNRIHRTYSRSPLVRYGGVHIVNTFWDSLIASGVDCRMVAQGLIQSSAFRNSSGKAVFFADSKETGYATLNGVDLGGSIQSHRDAWFRRGY